VPKAQGARAKLQDSIDSEIASKTRNVLFIRKRWYRQYQKTSVATLGVMRGTAVEPLRLSKLNRRHKAVCTKGQSWMEKGDAGAYVSLHCNGKQLGQEL